MRFISILILALSGASALGSQPEIRGSNSDEEWSKLEALARAKRPVVQRSSRRTPAQHDADRAENALAARRAAQAAQEFHSRHPGHGKARDAQRLEALLSLQGVAEDDSAQEHAAHRVAKAFRDETANPAADRLEVAIMSERIKARANLGGSPFGNNPLELERIAEGLRSEFGDGPELAELYIGVARTADMTTASRMARRVLAWSASPWAKAEAQSILDRHALLGTRLPITLPAIGAPPVDLGMPTGALRIVLFWSANCPGSVSTLARYQPTLPPDVQVVYVAVGGSPDLVAAASTRVQLPGVHCVAPLAGGGGLMEQLKLAHLPYVFVLNREGLVTGFGPVPELPGLVVAAYRELFTRSTL